MGSRALMRGPVSVVCRKCLLGQAPLFLALSIRAKELVVKREDGGVFMFLCNFHHHHHQFFFFFFVAWRGRRAENPKPRPSSAKPRGLVKNIPGYGGGARCKFFLLELVVAWPFDKKKRRMAVM